MPFDTNVRLKHEKYVHALTWDVSAFYYRFVLRKSNFCCYQKLDYWLSFCLARLESWNFDCLSPRTMQKFLRTAFLRLCQLISFQLLFLKCILQPKSFNKAYWNIEAMNDKILPNWPPLRLLRRRPPFETMKKSPRFSKNRVFPTVKYAKFTNIALFPANSPVWQTDRPTNKSTMAKTC